jgi:hypothetical protein
MCLSSVSLASLPVRVLPSGEDVCLSVSVASRAHRGGRQSVMQRRTLGALALVLLPIALADDAVVAAAAASSGISGFGEAFMASIGVIFGTELGDKTFFIAAIMSMRHPRFTVWFGAVGALAAMTVLSTIVGHVAPMLLPPAVSADPPTTFDHHHTTPNVPLRVSPPSPLLSLVPPHALSLSPCPQHRPLPPLPLRLPPASAADALRRGVPLLRFRRAHAERVTRGEQRRLRRARGG